MPRAPRLRCCSARRSAARSRRRSRVPIRRGSACWCWSTRSACGRSSRPPEFGHALEGFLSEPTHDEPRSAVAVLRVRSGRPASSRWPTRGPRSPTYNVDRARTPSVQIGAARHDGERSGSPRSTPTCWDASPFPLRSCGGGTTSPPRSRSRRKPAPATAGRCTSWKARPTTPPSSSRRRSCRCSGRCSGARDEHGGGGVMTAVDERTAGADRSVGTLGGGAGAAAGDRSPHRRDREWSADPA